MPDPKISPLSAPKVTFISGRHSLPTLESPGTPGLFFYPETFLTKGRGFTWAHTNLRYPALFYPTLNEALDGAAITLCASAGLAPYASLEMLAVYRDLLERANSEVRALAEAAEGNPNLSLLLRRAQSLYYLAKNPHGVEPLSKAYSARGWRDRPTESLGITIPPTPSLDAISRHWGNLEHLI